MDIQMKRGFLEACVLATLCREESYGYQIVKDVPGILGLTESTLYPLLKRLEGAGFVAVRSSEHNGRLRKYYRTTEEGRAKLDEFLREKKEVVQVYRYIEDAAGFDGEKECARIFDDGTYRVLNDAVKGGTNE